MIEALQQRHIPLGVIVIHPHRPVAVPKPQGQPVLRRVPRRVAGAEYGWRSILSADRLHDSMVADDRRTIRDQRPLL